MHSASSAQRKAHHSTPTWPPRCVIPQSDCGVAVPRSGHPAQCLGADPRHTGPVHALALSADGRTLYSGSADNTIRVWDSASGALLATCHHLGEGFLWTTPPDEQAPSGWFYTDRPELIAVYATNAEDSDRRLLTDDDPRRHEYLRDYYRPDLIQQRIHNPTVNDRVRRLMPPAETPPAPGQCPPPQSAAQHSVHSAVVIPPRNAALAPSPHPA